MQNEKVKQIINRLLKEMEEEDIGISLFTTCYQNAEELAFFNGQDRERVCKILKTVADDSQRHKTILSRIIAQLGDKCLEK